MFEFRQRTRVPLPTRTNHSLLWRPEAQVSEPLKWYEAWLQRAHWAWRKQALKRPVAYYLQQINQLDQPLQGLTDDQLRSKLNQLRQQVLRTGYRDDSLTHMFALIREVSGRVLGMRHFNSQLRGGLTMFLGCVAEMATGEGKTLTATLPAAAAALAGIPVHVITVNDYLAERDAQELAPLYEWLGLSLGCIQQGMALAERQAIYAKDVVYCTNKELVFDYLKDHLVLQQSTHQLYRHAQRLQGETRFDQQLMLRGLHFAIIDEADSVCMDEARTPLIISGQMQHHKDEEQVYQQAMLIARQLQVDEHYAQFDHLRLIRLLEKGEQRIDELAEGLGPYWVGRVRRYDIVRQALSALTYFEKDRHYLVNDGKVQIIDEHTGRVMPDRTWQRGLHQLIETKEGCKLSAPRETLAKISYQKFFRRYRWCCGMSGTATAVADEFWQIYRMPVVSIPTHHPLKRRHLGDTLCSTVDAKLDAIASSVQTAIDHGRSVLVGTSTVAASENIAQRLRQLQIDCEVLNAKQHQEEASIIAEAGMSARVTVATSMAGRGTDIKLHPQVEAAGGLHVILTELQEASRIDRQLAGRCARFGDPGSTELIVSLQDRWLEHGWYRGLAQTLARYSVGQRCVIWLMKRSQRRLEARHSRLRYQLLAKDERDNEVLAFSGANL